MSNNLHRVQNIFIADGTALPANDSLIAAVTPGKIGVYGWDMTALNPAGGDTISTQPYIYIVQGMPDGTVKRSMKIDGTSVINYTAKKYAAPARKVSFIGYNRLTTTGSIEVNPSTEYQFSIIFKNDKWLYSERPEALRVSFFTGAAPTQSTIADQTVSAINNGNYKKQIVAVKVGNGTGAYGLTGATNFGVEIWALDVPQNYDTTYTSNQVYFTVHVNDATGFGTTTTGGNLQQFSKGSGTYDQVFTMENYDLQYEGVLNRVQWPIPTQMITATAALITSSSVGVTSNGTTGQDTVTFSASVAGIITNGDRISVDGNLYEVKYMISNTVAVLTTPLLTTNATGVVLVRVKYDIINIEFNDSINTPTGVVAVANKSVVIAVPAITAGGAYTTNSQSGIDVKAILDAWMASTPKAFPVITI